MHSPSQWCLENSLGGMTSEPVIFRTLSHPYKGLLAHSHESQITTRWLSVSINLPFLKISWNHPMNFNLWSTVSWVNGKCSRATGPKGITAIPNCLVLKRGDVWSETPVFWHMRQMFHGCVVQTVVLGRGTTVNQDTKTDLEIMQEPHSFLPIYS